MRIYLRGPHIGPIGTILWSRDTRQRRKGGKGCGGGVLWGMVVTVLAGLGFYVSPILGWAVVLLFAAFVINGILGLRQAARRKAEAATAKDEEPEDDPGPGLHIPASEEYKKAHPEGPRDWEPPSRPKGA